MAGEQKFPGPVYSQLPLGVHPRQPSLLHRLTEWVPIYDLAAARIGFNERFNRATWQLDAEGGSAVRAAQCHLHFREQLHLSIDPRRITLQLANTVVDRGQTRWVGTYFLDGSDWKPVLLPVAKSASHREIVEICETRHDFRNGPRYRKYADSIAIGNPVRRNRVTIDTIEKLDGYFAYYLALIENIEANGVVSHADLKLRQQTGWQHRLTRTLWQDLAERDIGVAIDATGRIVRHTSGRHRMAVALALGVERIPVEIRMVHAHWLARQAEKLALSPADALLATLEQARATDWPVVKRARRSGPSGQKTTP